MADAYALKPGEGWTGHFGPDFIIKASERNSTNGVALVEYVTVRGEEPAAHTHPTEDEIFYVLEGEVSFRCGDQVFEMERGGLVFLPRGIEHEYTLRSDGPVRMIVLTAPPRDAPGGWGGFIGGSEAQ